MALSLISSLAVSLAGTSSGATMPTTITLYYASGDTVETVARISTPTKGGSEGEQVQAITQQLTVAVPLGTDLRFGGEFDYQGSTWEIVTVPTPTSYAAELHATAEYKGKADA